MYSMQYHEYVPTVYTLVCILYRHIIIKGMRAYLCVDYGVPLLRGLGADKNDVMDERRKLAQVYLAPEVRSHSFSKITQPPADVYR